jgi:hypothetical protein
VATILDASVVSCGTAILFRAAGVSSAVLRDFFSPWIYVAAYSSVSIKLGATLGK